MWHLRTFGGLAIEAANRAATPPTRRRPLALLALLAIAGERGLSRDKAVALLWPESDEERGRNSLSQALATLRRDMDEDDPVVGAAELRLNSSVVTSDVADFERCIAAGDLERAVASYEGPFLDGVFVREAAEFERWTEGQRRRLHDMCAAALERLARAADDRSDHDTAVAWWSRLATLEPTSARAVSGLMSVLARIGDRTGAQRQYRVYEQLMRQEFDAGPEPAVAALAASLFNESIDVAKPAAPAIGVTRSPATVFTPGTETLTNASPDDRRRPSRRFALMAGGAFLAVGLALLASLPTRSQPGSRRIAIAPFENLTNDTAFSQVGLIAANWITQGVAQIESLDVVPSTAVSAALTDASRGTDVVRRLASTTHAGVIVTGTVVRSGDSLRISATVVNARNNKPIRVIEPIAGPVADPLIAISALRDRLLGSLASGDARRGVALAGMPPKYDAYRAMMDGWALLLRQDYRDALPFLRRAVQLDSNFALAHVALVVAYGNLYQRDSAERVIADVDRFRDQLSVTDKLQVDAAKAMLSGDTEAQLRLERQYIARDSEPAWMFQTGFSAVKLLRPKEAIALLRASDSAMIAAGFKTQIEVLASAYHEASDFDAEASALERGRRLFPAYRAYAGDELCTLAALRRPVTALALADTLIAGTSADDLTPLTFLVGGAEEFRAHGDGATADVLARKITAWDAAHPGPPEIVRDLRVGAAWLNLGQLDSAASHVRRAARDLQDRMSGGRLRPMAAEAVATPIAGLLAVISARQGDTLRARATADSLAVQKSLRNAGVRDYWRAAILGQLGEREQAVTLLRQATHEDQSMSWWHSAEVLRPLHGYPPFTELITPKG